jgi:hypothetical protein
MARRNLLYEARVQAAAQVAPQIAALSEALQQARADRNAAIRTAAATSRGIGRAINRAGPSVKRAYSGAVGLGAPSQEFKSDAYRQSAANERAVTGTALASSLGNALKELSDRRIEAAAGRAYRTQAALGQYAGDVAKVQSKRQSLAAQEGLLAASNFSKLTEKQADRDLRVDLQNDAQAFQGRESMLQRKNTRLNASRQIAATNLNREDTQSFQAHQNALGRRASRKNTVYSQRQQNRRAALGGSAGGGPKPTATTTYKGRQAIQGWVDQYRSSGDMSSVAAKAKKQGVPSPILLAAANLYDKGYIAPREVKALRNMGVVVPKDWTAQVVKPYVRKRRGK